MKSLSKRREYGILSLAFLILLCASGLMWKSLGTDNVVLAKIGGEPLYIEEFQLLMEQRRGDTAAYFYEKYGAEDHKDFWNTACGNVTPTEYLKDLAWKDAVAYKTLQIRAKAEGAAMEIDFISLKKQWEAENQHREQEFKNGGILYGPKEFSLMDFYQYQLNNWKGILFQKYSEDFPVSKERAQLFYQEQKDQYYRQNGTYLPFESVQNNVELRIQQEDFQQQLDEAAKNADQEIDQKKWSQLKV